MRKDVRFSARKNAYYELECFEGDYDLFFALSNKWETHHGVWITGSSGPFQAKLHDQHECEGGADQFTNWDSLPDFTELAGACRFRDGRDTNPYGALAELYPYLALTLSYCRAKLLRRNVYDFQMILDDSGPVVDGPGKDQPDAFGFKEKTLNFFFGKRREVWPFIAYKD